MSKSRPTASEFLCSPYTPELEKEFFSRVMLPNGTVKTTSAQRLDALNDAALPFIQSLPFKPLNICDVAASSGISSAEWHGQLVSAGIKFTLYCTDLTIEALHIKNGWAEGLFDRDMRPIHISAFGRGMPPKASFPISLIPAFMSGYLKLSRKSRIVSLMSKSIENCQHLIVERDDIQKPGRKGFFHVLRAANILHDSYFTDKELSSIIGNLKSRLVDGGLFIVCRTATNGSNDGAIYKLRNSCFSLCANIGNGAEINHLVVTESALQATAAP